MTTKIGILSDTHLIGCDDYFRQLADACFSDVSVILHAGDLTDISVLDAFKGKEVHAVHGNMCHASSRNRLPFKKVLEIGSFTIGLIHGMGYRHSVEDYLIREFDDGIDCIVSGHTHSARTELLYDILFINPGSFLGSGRYGAPGTYAILEVGERLEACIHDVPRL